MKRVLLIIISVSILFVSCKVNILDNNISSLPIDTRDGKIIIETPNGQREIVYVIDGYICSIFNRGMNDFVLEIMPISDTSNIVNLIPYGSEQDKMLLVDCSVSGTKILIKDIVQRKYTIVDIPTVMEDNFCDINMIPLTLMTQEMIPLNGDKILYLNQGSFRSHEKRFFVVQQESQGHKLSRNAKQSMNVLDGTFLYNSGKNKLAFLPLYSPRIEYYDVNKKQLQRTVSIARDEDVEIVKVYNGYLNEYLFLNNVPICFRDGASDSERIIAVYHDEQGHSHILCFDWDGNFQDGFIAPGNVYAVSLSHGNIYCWERATNKDMLVLYDMHNVK